MIRKCHFVQIISRPHHPSYLLAGPKFSVVCVCVGVCVWVGVGVCESVNVLLSRSKAVCAG